MTKKRDALNLALPALENIYDGFKTSPRAQYTAITAIKEALAQPEQEPAKDWVASHDEICALLRQAHDALALTSYPLKRKWVGLSFGEARKLINSFNGDVKNLVYAVEIKLTEKNHD